MTIRWLLCSGVFPQCARKKSKRCHRLDRSFVLCESFISFKDDGSDDAPRPLRPRRRIDALPTDGRVEHGRVGRRRRHRLLQMRLVERLESGLRGSFSQQLHGRLVRTTLHGRPKGTKRTLPGLVLHKTLRQVR